MRTEHTQSEALQKGPLSEQCQCSGSVMAFASQRARHGLLEHVKRLSEPLIVFGGAVPETCQTATAFGF